MSHEVGGEFHLCDFPEQDLSAWPPGSSFFANGRIAIQILYRHWSKTHPGARLWLPDYFCYDVVADLRARDVKILFYPDDPLRSEPGFHDLRAAAGDMVMAVNYFGATSGQGWKAWRNSMQSIALVEDHSHDPHSFWAQTSNADYALASLRKTLPIPDGAVAWSPRGWEFPDAAPSACVEGSALKLAAMLHKRRYLDSGEALSDLKSTFLELQKQGEEMLARQGGEQISPWSMNLLGHGLPESWRRRRKHNVRMLLDLAPTFNGGRALFLSWPEGHCPFNAVYIFENECLRNRARRKLIEAKVYTPVHWPVENSTEFCVDLSKRILTIPVDFRCTDEDINRIAELLQAL